MNHLKRYTQRLSNLTALSIFIPGGISLALYIVGREILNVHIVLAICASAVLFFVLSFAFYSLLMDASLTPIEKVWQAVWHVSPGKSDTPAPKLEQIRHGREMISALVMQIYDLASSTPGQAANSEAPAAINASNLTEQMPLALFVLDKNRLVVSANQYACNYVNLPREKIVGRSVYDTLRMSFTSDDTLDTWLQSVSENRATDTRSWEHVRLHHADNKTTKQFDLAASFSKDDSAGHEVVLALFDRTASYDRADQATSYVALAVHELRTPLTVLRGYIEVFEDELGDQLSPEHQEFMRKMSASAQSLTAFVSNILNVARVDENQLVLQLQEANWNEVLPEIIKDLELRASVRCKSLELDIAENLPTVGIDRISMYEVVSNLVDNAIKYSAQSPKIIIHSRVGKDGTVETEVEDFGPGMPQSTVAELFTKFYRSHRSRSSIGGSGLGLFLVKAIITAHGGQVWVNSKEGEGSKFGFSLQAFASIKSDSRTGEAGIQRQANGWIKNHSMYRR